jgi:hypothetical protein
MISTVSAFPLHLIILGLTVLGEVVRIGPDELSFSSATAWKDVYAQRKSGSIFTKDHKFYITDDE